MVEGPNLLGLIAEELTTLHASKATVQYLVRGRVLNTVWRVTYE